jgi:hypothetical protein
LSLFRMGEQTKALQFARITELRLDSIKHIYYMDENRPAGVLSKQLAAAGEIDLALDTAHLVSNKELLYKLLSPIVVEAVKTRRDDLIQKALADMLNALDSVSDDSIENKYMRGYDERNRFYDPLSVVVIELSRAGKINQVIEVGRHIKINELRYEILSNACLEMTRMGWLDDALIIMNQFANEAWRSRAMSNVAIELVNQNREQEAYSITIKIEYADDRSFAYAAMAKAKAKGGAFKEARALANSCSLPQARLSANSIIVAEYAKLATPNVAKLIEADELDHRKQVQANNQLRRS